MDHRKAFAVPPNAVNTPQDLPSDPALTYDPKRSTLLVGLGSTLPTRLEVPQPAPAQGDKRGFGGTPLPLLPATDFVLQERLARGGFGDVWQGLQPSLDRAVAIKRLRDDRLMGADDDERRRLEAMFRHEATTTARLEHPNIVPVYQLGLDGEGRTVLAMKWVRGRRWSQLIREELDRPIEEFLARHLPILIDVAQAVAYAHSQGVLHRDLKPQQVMVGAFGEVQLMDWGLALLFGERAPELPKTGVGEAGRSGSFHRSGSLHRSGSIHSSGVAGPAGTPCFMAPEQTRDDGVDLGPSTDLYLLGGCLYYLLTGEPTHGGQNGLVAFVRASQGEVVPVAERAPERRPPAELCELVEGVLAADPIERQPATVDGFIEALQAYLSGASRQRRSRRLADAVEIRLGATTVPSPHEGEAPEAYEDLGELLEQLREAETLWPENPQVGGLRQRTRRRFGEAALERGDLALAKLQVSHLGPRGEDAQADTLRQDLDRAVEQRRRQSLQRRLALVSLALVVVVAALTFGWQEHRANTRLRLERDAAEAARADTEGLMGFLLDDLWEQLLGIGRADLLEPVARRAEAHYQGLGVDDLEPSQQLNLGAMSLTLGDMLRFHGDSTGAVSAYQRALAIFRQVEDAGQTSPRLLEKRFDASLWLSATFNDLGDVEAAEAVLHDLQQQIAAGLAAPDHWGLDLEVLHNYEVSAIDNLGISAYDEGRLDTAHQAFEQAVALAESRPETVDPFLLGGVLLRLAVTHQDRGEFSQALETIDRSLAIGEAAAEGEPLDPIDLGISSSVKGEILFHLGRLDESVAVMRAALPDLTEAVTSDPSNVEIRYIASQLLLQLGISEAARGDQEAAQTAWREAVGLIEPVRSEDSMAYLDDTLVRSLVFLDRVEEARPIAQGLRAKDWRHQDFEALWDEHFAGR